ncbi:FecR family protein [Methylomonas sp. SURF-1]|uniref:FecR family protein n=1 Tax=Methylomonas aurea TaxID=2952224 RepID=A0ABT1ULM4_9GAMM|nr:FecR family protein [Methylomonas sp. SURF-1]MCQ8182936.1 FecR family protein [Methylomonas sp. SURF-1]
MSETPAQRRERLQQEAVNWHLRLTSGSADPAAAEACAQWRRQSAEHDQAYRDLEALWQQLPAALQADRRRRGRPGRRRPVWLRHGVGLAAAASLLVAALAGFYPDYWQQPWADYRTRIGEQTSVALVDGSIAHLNTDTALDVVWNDNERRVVLLRGEAEFEVAHDPQRPFRVVAGTTSTEALGTRFVVRYDGNSGSVSLLQGKVRASRPSPHGAQADSAVLAPGQRLHFGASGLSAPEAADSSAVAAWRRGRLIANFITLGEAVAEINRYRRVPIRLLDAELAQRPVNIAVDLEHIDNWLDALQQTLPLTVVKAGPWLFLR